jgi:hypothetical protein
MSVLAILTLGWIALAGSMALAALGAGWLTATITGAVLATAAVLLLRVWGAGTYVNDAGFVVRRVASGRAGRWREVTEITVGRTRVIIHTVDRSIPTNVARWSLDILGRQQAYEAEADRLIRWFDQQ